MRCGWAARAQLYVFPATGKLSGMLALSLKDGKGALRVLADLHMLARPHKHFVW